MGKMDNSVQATYGLCSIEIDFDGELGAMEVDSDRCYIYTLTGVLYIYTLTGVLYIYSDRCVYTYTLTGVLYIYPNRCDIYIL